jgi:glycosyltransferase involved in cell wall biosynthesis
MDSVGDGPSNTSASEAADSSVLYVTKTSILGAGGGGEKRAREVVAGLARLGYEPTVVCGRTEPGLARWDEHDGARVRHVTCAPESLLGAGRLGFLLPRYLFAFASVPVLLSLLVREEFDVVVENMTPYPTLTVLLAKLFDVPIVAVQHEFHGRDSLEMYDPVTARIQLVVQHILRLFEYDAIVVPASHAERQLRSYGVATECIEVVPNGIDHEAYSRPEVDREPGRLVTVGRLCERKGQADLLRAFARLHEADPDVHLDVVGKGPQRAQFQRLAGELGVADAVTFHGFVSHDEKVRLLNRATVFVFASRQEGFGLAVLEAMAAGLPVVARRLPVYREFFEDGRHGHLVAPDAFETAFGTAVAALLDDEQEWTTISERNRSRAAQYGWDRTTEGMSAVIDAVVSGDAPKRRATVST